MSEKPATEKKPMGKKQIPAVEYEFTRAQEVEIQALVDVMRFVAQFQIVLGALIAAAGGVALMEPAIGIAVILLGQGAFNAAVAVWILRAAASFQKVVDTTGRDVTHMMGALAELHKVFRLQKGLILFVVLTIALGAALFTWTSMRGG